MDILQYHPTENSQVEIVGDRLRGSFISKKIFNLSKRVLTNTEVQVLEKGLGFVPTPSHIHEADLRSDLFDFSRKMRCKWHFRDEFSQEGQNISQFCTKSNGIHQGDMQH